MFFHDFCIISVESVHVCTHNESGAPALPVCPDKPALVWAVVDHRVVVVPEDVGGRLRGLPQVAVELQF